MELPLIQRIHEPERTNGELRKEIEDLRRMFGALQKSEEIHRLVADFTYDWETWIGPAGDYKYVSPSCERITGYLPVDFMRRNDLVLELAHPEDRAALEAHLRDVHGGFEASGIDFRILRKDGTPCWVSHKCQPVFGRNGEYLGRRGSNREVTELKRLELVQTARLKVLEELARNADLHGVLQVLLDNVEAIWPGRPVSILLLDPVTRRLRYGADRGLPDFYRQAVEGLEIGPAVGSSGAACHLGTTVVAEDSESHPNWAPFRELARSAGLRSCWAEPIRDVSGEVLGAFAVHAREPRLPADSDRHLLSETAHLARMAIVRNRIDGALRLRTRALEAADNAIVLMDACGAIQWVNPAFRKLTGYGLAEIWDPGMRILVSDPQDPAYLQLLEAIRAGRAWRGELACRRKDGSRIVVEQTVTPVGDKEGAPAHFISIQHDVTERRSTETQLRNLSKAVEASPMGTVVTDARGTIEYVNPRFTEITGYSREEAIGANPSILKSGLTPDEVYAGMWRALQGGRMWRGELCNRRKDGSLFWQKLSIAPVRDEQGAIAHLIGLTEDVTERRLLLETQARLALVVEQAAEAVAVLDLEGVVLYANPSFARLAGTPDARIPGKPVQEILREPAGEAILGFDSIHRFRESPWQGRFNAATPSGASLILDGSVSCAKDQDGVASTLVLVLRDVTAQTEMESHLRQAQKMDALGALASGVAHDFNNILAAIMSAAELMEWQLAPESPARSKLEIIRQASLRARELNKQILTFSRKDSGSWTTFDLGGIVKETCRLLKTTAPGNIKVEESPGTSAWLQGDPTQLHQVLLNLAINGCQAMKDKRDGRLSVGLAAVELGDAALKPPPGLAAGRYAVLTVSDNGCGMDAGTLERIFEPFFTTKEPGEGTGLGLSVVHNIVQGHGGAIQVSSERDRGTSFRIFLPSAPPPVLAPRAEHQEALNGTEHILLVDGDEIFAALVKQGLQSMGYRVTCHEGGEEGLEAFHARPGAFDLAIVDLALAGMSGAEFTNQVRKARPDFPVILATGAFQVQDSLNAFMVNFDEVLGKPVTASDLARAVRRVSELRGIPPRLAAGGDGATSTLAQLLEKGQAAVLLAEESPVIRSLLRNWLTKSGYRIQEAQDGQEAWEMFRSARDTRVFGLVLADLGMPRMDGLELIRRIRERDPDIPVAALAASDDPGPLKEALRLHVDEYLGKPFDSKALEGCVKRLFRNRFSRNATEHLVETARAVRMAQQVMEAVPEPDLPVASICQPMAAAGGDVFRCLRLPDGAVVLLLADVAGHSVLSSYAVASLLGMLPAFMESWKGVLDFVHRLNQSLLKGPFPNIPISVIAAHWRLTTGRLHIVNAGIPHCLRHRRDTRESEFIALNGTPLGLFGTPRVQERILMLAPGDRMLFHTDGLSDALSPAKASFRDRLQVHWERAASRPLEEALGAIRDAARQHVEEQFEDDLLLVGIEQPEWDPGPLEAIHLYPSVVKSADAACGDLRTFMAGLPRTLRMPANRRFDAMLALREALNNAVQHGNGDVPGRRVAVTFRASNRRLRVRVVDEGPGFDPGACAPGASPVSERGRGVPILKSMTRGLRMSASELEFHFDLAGAGDDRES